VGNVTIILESDKYRFDGGRAGLLCRQWGDNVDNPDSSALLIGYCTDNRIEGIRAERPAEYELYLSDGTVESRRENFRRRFVTLQPWNIRITSEDLQSGQCVVRVPDADLFLLSFSREGRPVQNGRVTVYLELRSSEISTDESGSVSVLGDPRTYILAVEDSCTLDVRPA
jgi:hypothetical protein